MVQTQEHLVSTEAQRFLLIYMVVVLVIVTALVILFFVVFQRRKNKLLIEKMMQQKAFDDEIQKTQTEIQEQTLKHVAWELHDNVGQLLAYASMQLKTLISKVPEDAKVKVNETSEVIKESLKEVRSLSKSLNNEVILNLGFEESLANELNRLKKMKFKSAKLNSKGVKINLRDKKHEIILFRILQEFLSNSVKYSEAENLIIELNYLKDKLIIKASDDGKGFDPESTPKGSGLLNMNSRAELINATLNLNSEKGEGVTLTIEYPLNA